MADLLVVSTRNQTVARGRPSAYLRLAGGEPIPSKIRNAIRVGAVFFAIACNPMPVSHRSRISVSEEPPSEAGAVAIVEAAAAQLPPDINVRLLERELNCLRGRHAQACRILREFGRATKGIGQAPSGQRRFMGTAYRVDRGVERPHLVVLEAASVPESSVGPTDIPLRVAIDSLPKDRRRDGSRLARALARGHMPSSKNKALSFAKTWKSENGRIAMATDGPSVRLIAEEATYVRQVGQKALVIKMKPALPGVTAPPGDGTYAELWAVTW